MRRRAAHWLLAGALVVAQLGVHAHAVSHLTAVPHGDVPADHGTAVCVAFVAAAGGALPAGALPLAAAPAPAGAVVPRPADPLLPPLALTRFASRAPPLAS